MAKAERLQSACSPESGACVAVCDRGPEREGAAPVILLHGFAQTPRSWDATAHVLRARGIEVHVPDLYAQASPFSMDAACFCVADLVRCVARASAARPVVAGYSMGGRIALEMLVRAQAEGASLPVSALVLEGAGLGPKDDASREAFRLRGEKWACDLRERGVAAFMDRWETLPLFASQRALPADVRARVRADRMARGAEQLAQSCESAGQHCQAGEADSLEALARAAAHGMEIVYVHGGLDEKYAAAALRVAERVPSARVESIAGAGHNAHLERPAAFAHVVERLACAL